jgi:hypothetical protein
MRSDRVTNSVAAADDCPLDVHLGGSSIASRSASFGDICSRLVWQGAACEMLFIARWSRVVSGKYARRAIPIEQFAQISRAGQNVVVRS